MQIMRSRDEKEAVWKELDMWVESEREFSIAYVKQALQAFKQEKHWSRVIQVFNNIKKHLCFEA